MLREAGAEVKDEGLARLSPLKARCFNLGRYGFLPAVPGGGMLRPLHDLADAGAETEDDMLDNGSPLGPRPRRSGSVSGSRKIRRSRDGFRWFMPGGLV